MKSTRPAKMFTTQWALNLQRVVSFNLRGPSWAADPDRYSLTPVFQNIWKYFYIPEKDVKFVMFLFRECREKSWPKVLQCFFTSLRPNWKEWKTSSRSPSTMSRTRKSPESRSRSRSILSSIGRNIWMRSHFRPEVLNILNNQEGNRKQLITNNVGLRFSTSFLLIRNKIFAQSIFESVERNLVEFYF